MVSFNDFNVSGAIGGLNTFSVIAPNAGPYIVSGKLSVPTLSMGGGQSSVVVTVSVNGSAKYTGPAGAEGFAAQVNCAAGDTIAIALASGAAADQGQNTVKASFAISQGVS